MTLATSQIEQGRQLDMAEQTGHTEGEADDHESDKHHRDVVNGAGRVPDHQRKHRHKQHGSELAVDPQNPLQDGTGGGDVGVEQNAADKVDREIVEEIEPLPQQFAGHGIEGDAHVVVLEGFQQHPAGEGHHHHGDGQCQHRPEGPGPRPRTRQTEHASPHADAGDNAGAPQN